MSKFVKPAREKCQQCEKSIFNDILKINGKPYHEDCVRCDHCQKKLSTDSFFTMDSKFYCEKHYNELNKPKPVKVIVPKKLFPICKDQIDRDGLTIVFSFLNVIEIGRVSTVSQEWYIASMVDQKYWKSQSLLMWPGNSCLSIEIQDWRSFYNTRASLEKKNKKKILQNCNMDPMKFNCPISWDSLSATSNHKVRTCNVCHESVYHCIDLEELDKVAKSGHCVMFNPYQMTGTNLEWQSKVKYENVGKSIIGRRPF
jgi:hypothetical protein